MNGCYALLRTQTAPAISRHGSLLVLPDTDDLRGVRALPLCPKTLLAADSRESLPKVRIDASRVAKRTIENRFHKSPLYDGCVARHVSLGDASKMRSGLQESRDVNGLRGCVHCEAHAGVKRFDTHDDAPPSTACNAHAPDAV